MNLRKLKFTFPVLTLCKGGAQRMIVEITNGLVDKGHDVTILMPIEGEVEFDIKAKLIKTSKTVLNENDYPHSDLIVSNFHLTVSPSVRASQQGKGKHVRLSLCYEPLFLDKQNLSFISYHETKDLFVLSQYQKNLIELNHGIKGNIIPIGVSHTFHNSKVRDHQPGITISTVMRKPEGGYSWQRNQEYLIQTLDAIKQNMPHVTINIICPPVELHSSQELQQLKLNKKFNVFTPADDYELNYYYSQADIFVTASIHEAAPLPGLEAMRCGAALVGLYSGGNKEYAIHGHNCLLSYRYENRLFEDIDKLIQDETLRKKIAAQGEKDSMLWTWERSVNQFEQKIYQLLN